MIILAEQCLIKNSRHSSKGNQLKWKKENFWYKADFLGYEALAEFVVSSLLSKTNIPDFVKYDLTQIKFDGDIYNGCKSSNFLSKGKSVITLSKLFKAYLNTDIYLECERLDRTEKDCIKYVVNNVIDITGLKNFGNYLTFLLEMDAFFLNEDRHFNNITVIYDENTNSFDYCPIFDNGAALFSDTTKDFPLSKDTEKCISIIRAKPFSPSFDDQIEAAESLYGVQFKHCITYKDIESVIEQARNTSMYSDEILSRIAKIMKWQLRTYDCFRESAFMNLPQIDFSNNATEPQR